MGQKAIHSNARRGVDLVKIDFQAKEGLGHDPSGFSGAGVTRSYKIIILVARSNTRADTASVSKNTFLSTSKNPFSQ